MLLAIVVKLWAVGERDMVVRGVVELCGVVVW